MKYNYIGDDRQEEEKIPEKITLEYLKRKIGETSLYANVSIMEPGIAIVKVMNNMGTGQYLATLDDDIWWLKSVSFEQNKNEACTIYKVKLNE